jgi:MFS family permease
MSRTMATRVGLYLGALQFVFGLIWVEYVIFLPQLAARAGIGGGVVAWLLVLDQLIFALCDWAVGVATDRVVRTLGRVGRIVAGLTAVSALAFLLLPFAARVNAGVFVALIVVWALTSAALRAPPLALLGRYTPAGQQAWVASSFVTGIGLATATAPILATRITAYDPRIQFALSAFAVFAMTMAMVWAERSLARGAEPDRPAPDETRVLTFVQFIGGVLLLQIGFQLFWFVSAPTFFAKFVRPAQTPMLLSLFWIGFAFLLPLATMLAKRFGALACMTVAALTAAVSSCVAAQSNGVILLGVAHFVCGAAWGAVMATTVTAAFGIGRRRRAGTAVGAFFSAVAVATFARIALVAAHADKAPAVASVLPWLPPVTWLAATLLLASVVRRAHHPAAAAPALIRTG